MSEIDRRLYRAKRISENRRRLSNLKQGLSCSDCSIGGLHPECYDFDHREGVAKKFNLSQAGTRSWETILEEIKKCDLVCANCHRLRTLERRQRDRMDDAWLDAWLDDQLKLFTEEANHEIERV